MKTFGLLGTHLSHTLSPQYFANKFLQENISEAEYQLFPLNNIEEIKDLLKHPTLVGFNVTIPYKSTIIPFLDEIDAISQEVGAVNCVVKENGRWIGYNTDVVGVEKIVCGLRYEVCGMRCEVIGKAESKKQVKANQIPQTTYLTPHTSYLTPHTAHLVPHPLHSALVLGSGGAAKAVGYVLKQKNIPFQMVSRKKTDKTITYNEVTAELIHQATFIINTTPVGMFPNIDEKPPILYSALHSNHILIDLIYNPEETFFLKEGKKRGASIFNGLTMFEAQAEASYLKFKNLKI